MSKKANRREPEMRAEYDFSKGVRGKYVKRFPKGAIAVVLEPDVAAEFRTARLETPLREPAPEGRGPCEAGLMTSLHRMQSAPLTVR
jgi:hypothetical protein